MTPFSSQGLDDCERLLNESIKVAKAAMRRGTEAINFDIVWGIEHFKTAIRKIQEIQKLRKRA